MPYVNLPPKITDATVQISFSPDNVTTTGAYWGYCTVADVLYEFPQKASMVNLTAAPPATHPIGQEITLAAFELHKMIEHFYQVPYTGNDAGIYATLRELNAKLATARLIDRGFSGSEPNLSEEGALRRQWVAGKVADIVNGVEHWEAPFGDAVAQAMVPVYDLSRAATVYPNPSSSPIGQQTDPDAQTPMFSMSRTPFKQAMM